MEAVSFAAPFVAVPLRGVLADVVFFAAVFFAGALRFLGALSVCVSAMVVVLALTSSSIGEIAFHVATQLAPQCSDA